MNPIISILGFGYTMAKLITTYGFLPMLLVFILLEIILLGKRAGKVYRLNDAITNIHIHIGFLVFKVLLGASYLVIYGFTFEHLSMFNFPNTIATYAACLVLYDLCVYWAHRSNHQINLLWTTHEVHHQSELMNLSVPLRVGWIDNASVYMIFFLPLAVIGFGPRVFFIIATINIFYQFISHTGLNIRFPKWVNYIIVTPEYHKLHHCRNAVYIDKNYGGMFMFWDLIFGTFQRPTEEPDYGLLHPIDSWDPVWSNVRFIKMMKDEAKQRKGFFNKIKILFERPTSLAKKHFATEKPEPFKKDFIPFDATSTRGLNFYSLFQTGIVVIFFMTYLINLEALHIGWVLLIAAALIFSGSTITGIMEDRPWIKWAELLRLAILLLLYFFVLKDALAGDKFYWNVLIAILSITSAIWFLIQFRKGSTASQGQNSLRGFSG